MTSLLEATHSTCFRTNLKTHIPCYNSRQKIVYKIKYSVETHVLLCSLDACPHEHRVHPLCTQERQSKSTIIKGSVTLLHRVESKAIRLIISPPLTKCLQFLTRPLSNVTTSFPTTASAVFYHYFHCHCLSHLNCSISTRPPLAASINTCITPFTCFFFFSYLLC